MRVTREVNISNIKVDKFSISTQSLAIADHIRSGGKVPPFRGYKEGARFVLKDGRHRITAYKLLGLTKIECKYYDA